MTSDSQDIRRIMNLMEAAEPGTLIEGWVDNLRTKRIHALGVRARDQMAQRIKGEYYDWLGKTSRDGDLGDLIRFMKKRVGFTDKDITQVLRDGGLASGDESADAGDDAEPEDGIPLPKDLSARLSDFGEVGVRVEKNDNHLDAGEILDNPRLYKTPGGDWDRKKIRAKLDKMPMGAKLTLGQSSFSRTTEPTGFADDHEETSESLGEARLDELASDTRLTKAQVDAVMDMTAAYINDEYLLDGPKNDHDDAVADLAASQIQGRGGRLAPNQGGSKPSGQYDTQELLDVLQQVNYSKDRVPSLQNKVKKSQSISAMSDQDMDELALIGFAFLRARS